MKEKLKKENETKRNEWVNERTNGTRKKIRKKDARDSHPHPQTTLTITRPPRPLKRIPIPKAQHQPSPMNTDDDHSDELLALMTQ